MKRVFSFFCFFWLTAGFSQVTIDTLSAKMLVEIKKDKSGKYIKRTFMDPSTGTTFVYEANPEKFNFEVEEDVILYLQKTRKKPDQKQLSGIWSLKYVTDFSGKNIEDKKELNFNERLEFNSKTGMFIKKPLDESADYTGCYSWDRKNGNMVTQSSLDNSQVIFPEKEGGKFSYPCIKSEDSPEEKLFLYSLESDHLVLFQFISNQEDLEMEQTVFLHYVKVHY